MRQRFFSGSIREVLRPLLADRAPVWSFRVAGRMLKLRVELALVIADLKELHAYLALQQSWSRGQFPCCFCCVPRTEMLPSARSDLDRFEQCLRSAPEAVNLISHGRGEEIGH